MTERVDLHYLRHMLDAIDHIDSFLEDTTLEDFLDDDLRHNATVRQFEVLGEAAGRVSSATCDLCSAINWSAITGMRHRLIRGYLEVDLEVVWATAKEDLPELRSQLEGCIQALEEGVG